MLCKARFFIPKIPVHLVIRGNSRKTIFAQQEDYQSYRKWLLENKEEQTSEIYADERLQVIRSADIESAGDEKPSLFQIVKR